MKFSIYLNWRVFVMCFVFHNLDKGEGVGGGGENDYCDILFAFVWSKAIMKILNRPLSEGSTTIVTIVYPENVSFPQIVSKYSRLYM